MSSIGGQPPQQYCLRWNNHQHNLLSVFEDLLNHEAFVDVTLACEGLQLKAHKMVLSACSPYFQSLLYNTPDRHPIVFLRDVRYVEMKALLEFMYRGEVSIDQDHLSSLLKVAESLKIKGLAEVKDSSSSSLSNNNNHNNNTTSNSITNATTLSYHESLLSPDHHPHHHIHKRISSPQSAFALGPKRKRGRPRRLSGSEAVPMASAMNEFHFDEGPSEEIEKGVRDGSQNGSPRDTAKELTEVESIDGRNSGFLAEVKKEPRPESSSPESSCPLSPNNHHPIPFAKQNEPKLMSEMSVRGLDLLRYANISGDGTYRCLECEKLEIIKNFKNKYSFQRHAFLYHEGSSRKVFPCTICHKEFSRPDKMKQHLKVTHDCVIPKANSSSGASLIASAEALALAAVSAATGNSSTSSILVNPFLHLNDPASTEGKIGSLKESGSRM